MKNQGAFITLISVFFFWGFVAASNDILIPVFKEKLNLEQWQSQMISFAFYVAYTVGSILYLLASKIIGEDVLHRIGYKNGISLGLVISAVGTMLFYPAAELSSFGLMISGLFIVGLGFSLQQTAANPLVITIGDASKGAQRLSMAGGINNVGTTIGPLIVSFAIFGTVAGSKLDSLDAVKMPYLILGAAFLLVALLFRFSSLPNNIDMPAASVESIGSEKKSALSYPQLWMGMIAIFLYVGVEVSTASNLPEFMRVHLGTATEDIAPFVSLFWASLMIGRWTGAVGAMDASAGLKGYFRHLIPYLAFGMLLLTNRIAENNIYELVLYGGIILTSILTGYFLKDNSVLLKSILRIVMPYLAFGVFLSANRIAGNNTNELMLYGGIILVLILADYLSKGNPAKQLLLFSLLGILALIVGIIADGMVSVYAFISVGLFCSTLWPCIFTLAIAGLGKHTNAGSGFLIMMIMGGGFISLLQGFVADESLLGIQQSYWIGVLCFAYLAFYGWKTAQLLRSQGISYEKTDSAVH
ncbi:MAG: MFS transporter [Bacteroidia bacterium]|jgi:FHS family L-fucose permease-like MFS transporter